MITIYIYVHFVSQEKLSGFNPRCRRLFCLVLCLLLCFVNDVFLKENFVIRIIIKIIIKI